MSKGKEIIQDDVTQAILIADSFNDEFVPFTNDKPLALLSVVNRPLIEYTLEFLALGGIEETYLFCSNHANAIKKYIAYGKEKGMVWSQTMQVNIIVSESCRSLGDCLRDLDAKGLIRGNFVLAEPGVISNIKLLPIIKKHNEIAKKDKGAAMTLVLEEAGLGQYGRCPREELLVASNSNKRILLLRKLGIMSEKKIHFPLDIFVENSNVSIQHNLKDTHIAICSPSVLPLFSDNFDYQTRDDFIKGLLMIDEVLDSTIYAHVVSGAQHGGAVTNWRMYQAISRELVDRWMYPIVPLLKNFSIRSRTKGTVYGLKCQISKTATLSKTILGNNVSIGNNVLIEDSYIHGNVKIEDNCVITHSVIGENTIIKQESNISEGSIIGENVILEKKTLLKNSLVQSTKPDECEAADKLSEQAYIIKVDEDDELAALVSKYSRLRLNDNLEFSEDDGIDSSDSEDDMSYTNSPVPDDTNLFFNEVTDSLARGFEDKLQCDNLILEINSSRYAYNVTLKEVNYNVVKVILNLPFLHSTGQQYLPALSRSLVYFSPILKNYIRSADAMADCLQAIEDVAAANNELNECVSKVLNWFYDKDYLSEESILQWFEKLEKGTRFFARIQPFINWLQEAEEASSSEEDSE